MNHIRIIIENTITLIESIITNIIKKYVKGKSEYFKTYICTYYMQNRARIIEQIKTRYRNYTIDNPVVVPNPEVVPKTYPK